MLKLGIHKTFKGRRLYEEVWRDVVGYEGRYKISNLGRVKALRKKPEVILRHYLDPGGYKCVVLFKDGVKKHKTIHRLVAEMFIPNPNNKPCVDHINTIRTDNRKENLRWVTHKENNENELTRKHSSESRKGKIRSEEHKKKLREISKDSKRVMCIETGVIYNSTNEARRQTGINNGSISLACRGKCKRAGGYTWKYI